MFEIFFGTDNPFTVALDDKGRQVKLIEKIEADIHKEAITERGDTHTEDLTVTCECTLEEFYHGCSKTVKFTRDLVYADGKTEYADTRATKEIEVKPGMTDGTELRFPGEGSQKRAKHFGDLVIILK